MGLLFWCRRALGFILLYSLLLQAGAAILPSPTDPGHVNIAAEFAPKTTGAPFQNGQHNDLARRATTSTPESSVCGYFDGDKHSRLACQYSWSCAFHSSNSAFPGMVGCCPEPSTTLCSFHSTCYDGAKVSATPSLRSLSSDLFVQLCTASSEAYCFTWTWPELSLTDYRCSDDSISTIATLLTAGSLTDATISEMMSVESISISWIGDGPLQAIASQAQNADGSSALTATSATESLTESLTGSLTESSTPSATESPTSAAPTDPKVDSESSTPVGAIAGGVVGGVIGLLGIIAAIVMYYRLKKANTDHNDPKDESGLIGGAQDSGSKELDILYTSQAAYGLHSQPAEAGGVGVSRGHELDSSQTRIELDAPQKRYEME